MLVKIPYVALPNIVLGEEIVRAIQNEVTPGRMAEELLALWRDPQRRAAVCAAWRKASPLRSAGPVQRAAGVAGGGQGNDPQGIPYLWSTGAARRRQSGCVSHQSVCCTTRQVGLDIILTTNSPGEVAAWLTPTVRPGIGLSGSHQRVRASVYLRGGAECVIRRMPWVDHVYGPAEFVRYALFGIKPAGFAPGPTGVVCFWAAICLMRHGWPSGCVIRL